METLEKTPDEELAAMQHEAKQDYELVARGQEELAHIDFAALRNIFEEMARRSGEYPKNMRFCKEGAINIIANKQPGIAQYLYDDKTLVLNVVHPFFLGGKNEEEGESDRGDFARRFFGALAHEEAHAAADKAPCISREKFLELEKEMREKNQEISVGGYNAIQSKEGRFFVGFQLVDEAVTDAIAGEVFDEYMKRTGERKRYSDQHGNSTYVKGYEDEQRCLVELIRRAAHSAGLPEEVVWSGLKQGYFAKNDTTLKDLRALLSEIVDNILAEALERIPTTNTTAVERILVRLTPKEDDVDKLASFLAELADKFDKFAVTTKEAQLNWGERRA